VGSHLASIGIEGEQEFAELVELAVAEGERRDGPSGGAEFLWRDDDGASLAVDLSADDAVQCVRPSFSAAGLVEVVVGAFAEDPECPFCSRLVVDVLDDEDGSPAYPLALELENVVEARAGALEGARARVAVTAFAEQLETWPDEVAYDAAGAGSDEPRFASRSFVPSGLFSAETPKRRFFGRRREAPPTAHAILTGVVREGRVRRNSVTGHEFSWARVETYGGVYDLVASPEDVPDGFEEGSVVQGTFWLIGRLEA
jgi:hypothetical protein